MTGSRPKPARRSAAATAVGGLAFALAALAWAAGGVPGLEPKLLPPEQAFRFSARAVDPQTIEARFDVADGYYLYRDKLRFSVAPGGPALGGFDLPPGARKRDEFFGDVETYRGPLIVRIPVVDGSAGQAMVFYADSQGCADAGICYPPTTQQLRLALPRQGAGPGPVVEAAPARKGLFN
ncbi:MAG: protein-disulfide reductase DsbD N-terminal domain-containing protein [Burkholderiales bacterium]